jgi:hypothetical protein
VLATTSVTIAIRGVLATCSGAWGCARERPCPGTVSARLQACPHRRELWCDRILVGSPEASSQSDFVSLLVGDQSVRVPRGFVSLPGFGDSSAFLRAYILVADRHVRLVPAQH